MNKKPLVSFHLNSFNQLFLLKNVLKSFAVCNEYPNVEWIVADYGSKDGSREFIEEYARKSNFLVKYIFDDEKEYFEQVKKRGIPIESKWARFTAMMGKYRNEIFEITQGEYIFDAGNDHQFIRRGNWLEEIFEIFKHREAKIGWDDIACIVPCGYYRWRLDKPNNARCPVENDESVPYYVAKEKPYVAYSVVKKSFRDKLGKFFDPIDLKPDTPQMKMWAREDLGIFAEASYQQRCQEMGLKRIFMKYPISISFENFLHQTLKMKDKEFIIPLWTLEEMKKKFGKLDRPISSEELCDFKSLLLRHKLRKIKQKLYPAGKSR